MESNETVKQDLTSAAVLSSFRTLMSRVKNIAGFVLAATIFTVGISLGLGTLWLQVLALLSVFVLGFVSGIIVLIHLAILGYTKSIESEKSEG